MASSRAVKPLALSEEVIAALRAEAERAYPEECCGALLEDAAGRVSVRPLDNVAANRGLGFLVSAKETLALEREADAGGLTVRGLYHSHPDGPGVPSASDGATAWADRWTVITPVVKGRAGEPQVFRFDETTREFTPVLSERSRGP